MLKQITLKNINDKFTTYTYLEALALYKSYCNNYINLKIFSQDANLTIESCEILIKTMRKDCKK